MARCLPESFMKHTLPSRLLLLVLASLMFLLTACEGTVIRTAPDPFAQDNIGWIRGRVCDPSGASWLTDALVYTNLVDEYGHIYAYRYTYTDRDGWFVLEGIPQTPNLPVFATKGNEIIAEWEVDVFAGAVTEIPEGRPASTR